MTRMMIKVSFKRLNPEEKGRRALMRSNRSDTFLRTKERHSRGDKLAVHTKGKKKKERNTYSRRGFEQSCHSSLPISGQVINFSSLLRHNSTLFATVKQYSHLIHQMYFTSIYFVLRFFTLHMYEALI